MDVLIALGVLIANIAFYCWFASTMSAIRQTLERIHEIQRAMLDRTVYEIAQPDPSREAAPTREPAPLAAEKTGLSPRSAMFLTALIVLMLIGIAVSIYRNP